MRFRRLNIEIMSDVFDADRAIIKQLCIAGEAVPVYAVSALENWML